jgi:hypothetical protein
LLGSWELKYLFFLCLFFCCCAYWSLKAFF